MPIVGGLGIHRKQITFDYLDTVTGEVRRGQIAPADREHVRAWLARFAGRDDVAFALEGCTGWRYVAEELALAGCAAHLAEPADTAFARGGRARRRRPRRRLNPLRSRPSPDDTPFPAGTTQPQSPDGEPSRPAPALGLSAAPGPGTQGPCGRPS
jgi:hypothetical protein